MYFLSTLAIFKNEALIIEEWLKHHIWQGVEHFYLINNNSTDNYIDILSPYIDQNLVTLYNLPGKHQQVQHYNSVFTQIRDKTLWLMVIDIDEYYYCTSKILKNYILDDIDPKYNHIVNTWRVFGSSGYIKQPSNIRESFIHRVQNPHQLYRPKTNIHKYIIKTKDTKSLACHNPTCINSQWNKLINDNYIKLNHYQIMSEEYFQTVKMSRGAADILAHEHIRNMEYFHKRNLNNIIDLELKNLSINNYEL